MVSNPKPFKFGYLPEVDGHKIYYAQYGNPTGTPIIVCHGGPGDESKPKHVNLYDLSKYHLITFDQRGCGNSLPLGEIKSNSTQDLVSDMERLRTHLKINKWYVGGGSWGSTLALAYAESFSLAVKGLLLSSIFLARPSDEAWSFSRPGGITQLFPDLWQSRLEFFTKFASNPIDAPRDILKIIASGNEQEIKEVVAGVLNWEGNLMSSQSDISIVEPNDVTDSEISGVKVFLTYEQNNFFLKDNQLIKNVKTIKDIPTIIVHGRYDVLCTMDNAWELHKNIPNSELVVLPSSNHHLTADGNIARKYAFSYFLSKQSL